MPPDFLKQLKKLPDDVLSFNEAVEEVNALPDDTELG